MHRNKSFSLINSKFSTEVKITLQWSWNINYIMEPVPSFSHERLKILLSLGYISGIQIKQKTFFPPLSPSWHQDVFRGNVWASQSISMYVYSNILVIHLLPQLKMGYLVSCQLVSINTTDYIYKFLGQI